MFPQFNILFDAFERKGEQLFYVGGCVRDWLNAEVGDDLRRLASKPGHPELEREKFRTRVREGVIDVDFATSALPETTIEILKSCSLPPIPIGIEFGTIQTILDGVKVEITTFRCAESYTKGSRKPGVVFGKTVEEDLARRDFTINAIAMKRDGTKVDPFEGFSALVQGLLLCPINPEISFSDDPLRMMRAARFQARGWGLCKMEFDAMQKLSERIKEVSTERVFEEMSKILMSATPSRGLRVMADTGLLRHAFPELQTVVDFKQNQGKWHSKLVWDHTLGVVDGTPPILEVRWAALYHDVAKPQTYSETDTGVHFYGHDYQGSKIWNRAAERLKVSTAFKEDVHFLVLEHLQPSMLSTEGVNHCGDAALRRFAHRCGDRMENLFHLSLADITSHKPDVVSAKTANCRALKERIEKLLAQEDVTKLKLPPGTGLVVCEAVGIKPGKELGQIMKVLNQMLIDGTLRSADDIGEVAKKLHAELA